MTLLPRSFFARKVDVVARDLVGVRLVHEGVVLRITECEAYGPIGDTAAHCRFGKTERTAPLWGPPGHAYVYLCYGIHWMLNLVAGKAGEPQGVLIRSADVIEGHDVVVSRRRAKQSASLVAGPGKVGQALALDGSYNHHDVCAPGGLEVHRGSKDLGVVVGKRVGIGYASLRDQSARRRYALAGSKAVTERAALT